MGELSILVVIASNSSSPLLTISNSSITRVFNLPPDVLDPESELWWLLFDLLVLLGCVSLPVDFLDFGGSVNALACFPIVILMLTV